MPGARTRRSAYLRHRLAKAAANTFLLGFGLLAAASGSAVTVELHVKPRRIRTLENFEIQVVVRGAIRGLSWPDDLITEKGFRIVSAPTTRQSLQIFNGRPSAEYYYKVVARPLRAGTITVPAVSLAIDGDTYTTDGATVEVLPVEKTDDFFLELEASRHELYVEQPFALTLRVYARALRGRFAERPPFLAVRGVRQASVWPQLEIPWFEGKEPGFETEDLQTFANRWNPSTNDDGFPVNNYAQQGFFNSEPWRFRLPRRRVRRQASDGKEYDYWEFTLEKEFRAAEVGDYTFEPVTARGYIVSDHGTPGGQPMRRDVLAQSDAVSVRVKPVPLEGRPPTFTGAIGRFEIAAELLAPEVIWVGNPVTLKLTVSGRGKLETVGPVPLEAQPELARRFRIHEPQAGDLLGDGRSKVFTYGLRVKSGEVDAVPPIEFAFFDPESETYETVYTERIPIEVKRGEAPDVQSADEGSVRPRRRAVERVVYPIYDRPDALEPQEVHRGFSPLQVGLLAAPPLLYFLLVLATVRRRRLAADPGIGRARSARRRARSVLEGAEAAKARGQVLDSYQALAQALIGFIADKLNRPAAGMTPGEAVEALRERGVSEEAWRGIDRLLAHCEQARFGMAGPAEELEECLRSARRHLASLEKDL